MNNNIRKAAFVPLFDENSERLKYNRIYSILKYFKHKMLSLKREVNSLVTNAKKLLSFFDWNMAMKSSFIWIAEAAIEGLLLNFATNQLFGFRITPWTILSYGILVKQTIDISRRLINGTTKHINEKNK